MLFLFSQENIFGVKKKPKKQTYKCSLHNLFCKWILCIMKSFAPKMVIKFNKLRKCYRCTDEQEDEIKSLKKYYLFKSVLCQLISANGCVVLRAFCERGFFFSWAYARYSYFLFCGNDYIYSCHSVEPRVYKLIAAASNIYVHVEGRQ